MTQASVLAIIPARGGSKGIPRKNIRFLAGEPLISYAIKNATNSRYITHVAVSTDDEEIAGIAAMKGCVVIRRPKDLARDDVPLDPVIHHAVQHLERETGASFEVVVTLQPTSPLLSFTTLDKAIKKLLEGEMDTIISVVDDRHLSWTIRDGKYVPRYEARLNRQLLPPELRETGGLVVTRRRFVTESGRFGPNIDLIEVSRKEAVDIDHPMDWWIAEKLLLQKRILFRTVGYNEIGLGHIYRTLLIAGRLIDHELLITTDAAHSLGKEMIESSFYPLATFSSDRELMDIIDDFAPDIIVNDILDTSVDYIRTLKNKGIFVVSFEDMGDGAPEADLVINALYEEKYPMDNCCWGQDYYCLREEFFLVGRKEITKDVKNILITFGGTDANNYTLRVVRLLNEMRLHGIDVTIIAGRGYMHMETLLREVESIDLAVDVLRDVKTIGEHMRRADIVLTSAGRTVFEIASIGTPMIVLAQNNRELHHTFAGADNGIINLGLGTAVSDDELKQTLIKLMTDVELRRKCHRLMQKNNLSSGVDNVLGVIFSRYAELKKRRPQ